MLGHEATRDPHSIWKSPMRILWGNNAKMASAGADAIFRRTMESGIAGTEGSVTQK